MKDYKLYEDIHSILFKINLLLDNYEIIKDCNLEEPLLKELDKKATDFKSLCDKLYDLSQDNL